MSRKRTVKEDEVPIVESTYKTKIKYKCPKRGWVEEEVEVKRFKAPEPPKGHSVEIAEAVDLVEEIDIKD